VYIFTNLIFKNQQLMKSIATIILLLLSILNNICAQEKEIRLIVRGDDIGFSHTVNQACIDSYQQGIMSSVEIMVPTPWFMEAVQLLKENPGLDVGIHLTLTSEWENLKWQPLTNARSITDENGYFYPMIWPNDNYGEAFALSKANWKIEEIEKELRAQIELAQKHIPHVSHLSTHMGCGNLSTEVSQLVKTLAGEYGLAINTDEHGVQRARYVGAKATPAEKEKAFIAMLKSLTPGTYLFVDHPGYNTPEMQAIYHTGYEDVAVDREGVTKTFTSKKVKETINELGIKIINYASLIK